ncbi:MAG: TIGR04283 family arsenosugar biosynthesis glycosyltransferase, partial [Acidobacteriota bacterium]
ATLAAVEVARGAGLLREIVVADGGSADATAAVAEAAGARVVHAPRGRGPQLAAGAAAATGEWLCFLHADTRLGPRWCDAVAQFVAHPGNEQRAGYFAFRIDDDTAAARRLERMVAWRARAWGLPYGDQGLVIAKRFFALLGGYPPLPLMEDVALVRRIGKLRLVALDAAALTSAERYRRDGYLRRSLRNLFCLSLYFLGVPPRAIRRIYG